jgi:NADH-quinone oxidoreductase subunit J
MVLMLFTVMLLNLNKESEPHKSNLLKFGAVISGGLLLLVLLATLKTSQLPDYQMPGNAEMGYVENIGKILYTKYILPFEVASILFITAMIGAVVLAKKQN